MNKIIKITDSFIKNHKNKIMLISLAVIFTGFIGYFIKSTDNIQMKAFVVFLSSGAFLCAFYGIKLLQRIKNKIMPIHKFAVYIVDMLCLLFALAVILAEIYDFILTFDGFNLIICSVITAFFNAVTRSRS
jgi:hypothetical protein